MTPPTDLTKIRVRLSSASPGGGAPIVLNGLGVSQQQGAMGTVQAKGTFVIDGVLPGSYCLSTIGEPGGWRAKSAMVGERDIFDTPLAVSQSDIAGVEARPRSATSSARFRRIVASGCRSRPPFSRGSLPPE
jgi:hypothetical protein